MYMCWLLLLVRMIFKKREPIESPEAYSLANRDHGGYVDEELTAETVEPFPLDQLPMDLVGKVFSQLSYTDAVHLRQTSRQILKAYDEFRREIKGPRVMAYINIEEEKPVTRARPFHMLRAEAVVIPEESRRMFFRNADVTLMIRLGTNEMTENIASIILQIFARSNLESVKLRAATVSRETKDLLNNLKCADVCISIGRYDENVSGVDNVTSLRVTNPLFFFQLEAIIRHDKHLQFLTATVTAASLPRIFECIDEWKASRRTLTCWYFRIPHVEIVRDFGGVPIDWRRSFIRQEKGTERLLMHTSTLPRLEEDAFTYQTLNWLKM